MGNPFGECQSPAIDGRRDQIRIVGRRIDRHGDGATVGLMDGHAEWMTLEQYADELNERPGRLWCNPGASDGRYAWYE